MLMNLIEEKVAKVGCVLLNGSAAFLAGPRQALASLEVEVTY